MLIKKLSDLLYRSGQPMSYQDESLTQYEYLCTIWQKIQEMIEALNEVDIDKIEILMNEKIREIKDYIDSLNNSMKNYVDNATDITYKKSIDYSINLVNETITLLQKYARDQDEILKNQLIVVTNNLQNQINNIEKFGLKIIDPTTRKLRLYSKCNK